MSTGSRIESTVKDGPYDDKSLHATVPCSDDTQHDVNSKRKRTRQS